MVAPDIQQAIEQVGKTKEEIAKGEAEFVKVRGEALKFRREAERLPVKVKIPKRELLAGGLRVSNNWCTNKRRSWMGTCTKISDKR